MGRLYGLSDFTNSIESEQHLRPFLCAVKALAQDQQPHPISAAENARANISDNKLLKATLETIHRGAVIPTSTTTGAAFSQQSVSDITNIIGPMSAFGQTAPLAI